MRSTVLLAAAVALFACARQQDAGPVMQPAPLPRVAVGDTFEFDDGRVERVTALSGGQVQWRGLDGFTYRTSSDVLAPRLAWSDGETHGERRFVASAPSLFPLSIGSTATFNTERRIIAGVGSAAIIVAETWHCRADGTARIATRVGEFDTFRVDCALTTEPPTPRLTRSLYYSPAINYFVRRDDKTAVGGATSITLTTFTTAEPALPADTERLRSAALQSALESVPSGQAMPWRDTADGVSGTVIPDRTIRSRRLGWCRGYVEVIEAKARRYRFERLACRADNGIWRRVARTASSS